MVRIGLHRDCELSGPCKRQKMGAVAKLVLCTDDELSRACKRQKMGAVAKLVLCRDDELSGPTKLNIRTWGLLQGC